MFASLSTATWWFCDVLSWSLNESKQKYCVVNSRHSRERWESIQKRCYIHAISECRTLFSFLCLAWLNALPDFLEMLYVYSCNAWKEARRMWRKTEWLQAQSQRYILLLKEKGETYRNGENKILCKMYFIAPREVYMYVLLFESKFVFPPFLFICMRVCEYSFII